VRGLLYRPAGQGPFPALVVIHEDHGLTDWVKEQAKRLCDKGYVVLAVDLYRGQVVTDVLDAHIMDRGLPEDRVLADLKAAVDYLAGRKDVRASALGVIGWGMGGGYALDAAVRDPRLRAAVVCYGRLTTDPALLASLRASVLGIFAGKDEGISPETIDQFRAAMQKAGKRVADTRIYPACGHGFMNPSSPYTSGAPPAEAIADAWNKLEAYLDAELNR
jgi:carboxymethylenebutenolidase